MGDPVVANILKTGAILWYAPVGEAVPDENTVNYGDAWGGNWARVGFTKAPLTMMYEAEEAEVMVEEHLGPLDGFKVGEQLNLETMLAEMAAQYLALATGQDPDTDVTTTAAGVGQVGLEEVSVGDSSVIEKFAWGFEGLFVDANGNQLPVRVFVWKGSAKLNGEMEFSQKSGETPGIPLQIKSYVDPGQAAGERLWKYQRVTAPASS